MLILFLVVMDGVLIFLLGVLGLVLVIFIEVHVLLPVARLIEEEVTVIVIDFHYLFV